MRTGQRIAAVVVGILVLAIAGNALDNETSASGYQVKVVAADYLGGGTELNLSQTYEHVKTDLISFTTGEEILRLPDVNGMDPVTIDQLEPFRYDDTGYAIAIGGTGTVLGSQTQLLLTAVWPDNLATTPDVGLGVRIDGLQLSTINPDWQLPGGLDPGFQDVWITIAPAGHTVPAAITDGFYPATYTFGGDVTLPADTHLLGEINVEDVIGTFATQALGLDSSDYVDLGGTFSTSWGILNGNFTGTSVDLVASFPIGGSALLPEWITPGNIELGIGYAAGSLTARLETLVTMDSSIGLPGNIALAGDVTYGPTISVALNALVGDWTDAFGIPWLDLTSAELALAFDDTGATGSFAADFLVGTETLAVSIEVSGSPGAFEATVAFETDLTIGDVVALINGQNGATSFLPDTFGQSFGLTNAQFTVEAGTTSASFALTATVQLGGAEVSGLFALSDPGGAGTPYLILSLQSSDGTLASLFGGDTGPLGGSLVGDLQLPAFSLTMVQSIDGTKPLNSVLIPSTELNQTAREYFEKSLGTTDPFDLTLGADISMEAQLDLSVLGNDFVRVFGYQPPNNFVTLGGTLGASFDLASGSFDLAGIDVYAELPATTISIPPFGDVAIQPLVEFAYAETPLGAYAYLVRAEATFTLDLDGTGGAETFALGVSFSANDFGDVAFRAWASLLDWDQPFGITWLTLDEVTLSLELIDDVLGTDLSVGLHAEGTVGTAPKIDVLVDAYGRFGDNPAVSLTVALEGIVTMEDVLNTLGMGDITSSVPPDVLGLGISDVTLAVTVDPAGFTVSGLAAFQVPLLGNTFQAQLYFGLDSTPNVTLGIRLDTSDVIMLSEVVNPAIAPETYPPELDFALVSEAVEFGLIFSTGVWDAPSSTVDLPTLKFFAPLFGAELDPDTFEPDEPFVIDIADGFAIIAELSLPEDLEGHFELLGMNPGVHVVGSLPLFSGLGVSLEMELSLNPNLPPEIDYIEDADLKLLLSADAESGARFEIEGEVAFKLPAGMPAPIADLLNLIDVPTTSAAPVSTDPTFTPTPNSCANQTTPQWGYQLQPIPAFPFFDLVAGWYCYDVLSMSVSGGLTATTSGNLAVTFGGAIASLNDTGTPGMPSAPWNPLGLQWIGLSQIELQVSVGINAGAPNISIGFFGSGQVGPLDDPVLGGSVAGQFGVSMLTPPVPPFVRPSFDGFRLTSETGVQLGDVVDLFNFLIEPFADPDPLIPIGAEAAFPDIALRNLDLSIGPLGAPDLCIPQGLIIAADLYINPVNDLSGLPPQCEDGVLVEPPQEESCLARQAEGCFAGVELKLTTTGIKALGEIAGFDLGLIVFDDAAIDLELSLDDQHFNVYGGVDLYNLCRVLQPGSCEDPIATGDLAISIALDRVELYGFLEMFGVATLVDGHADIGILKGELPEVYLHVLLAATDLNWGYPDWGAIIAAEAAPVLAALAEVIEVLDGFTTDLETGDPVWAMYNLKARLAAKGLVIPEWLDTFIEQANAVLEPLGKISQDGLDVVLNGFVFPALPGIPGYWYPSSTACSSVPLVDVGGKVINGDCYGTWLWYWDFWAGKWKVTGITRGWWIPRKCWGVPPLIPGTVVWNGWSPTCYTVPPTPPFFTGGLCNLIFPDWLFPDVRDENGRCTLALIIEGATEPMFETFLEVVLPGDQQIDLDVMQERLLSSLRGDGELLEFTCAEFEFELGSDAQAFGLALDMALLGEPINFGFEFDFADPIGSTENIVLGLLFPAYFPATTCDGLNTDLFDPDDLTLSSNPVDPPAPRIGMQRLSDADEGALVTATGIYTQGGPTTARQVVVDWGDGTTGPVTIAVGTTEFSVTHTYEDDGTFTVTLIDGSESASDTLNIRNVSPTADLALSPSNVPENAPMVLDITITDPGDDTHIVEIGWGDGSQTTLTPAHGTSVVSATHVYPDDDPTATPLDPFLVEVTIADDDGGAGSASIVANVVNQLPADVEISSPDVFEGNREALTVTFTDQGAVDTHVIEFDWDGDGTYEQALIVPEFTRELTTWHHYLDDDPSGVSSQQINAFVKVTDDDTGAVVQEVGIIVHNVAPFDLELRQQRLVDFVDAGEIDADNDIAEIHEGDPMALLVAFLDPGVLDSHDATVDWGDGTAIEEVAVAADAEQAARAILLTHTYVDDNPTNTPEDEYTIVVTVSDDDLGTVSGQTTITVLNVPVVLDPGPDQNTEEGTLVEINPTFTDVGVADTHTATVDWGDGTGVTAVAAPSANGSGSLTSSHVYADNGLYTVTVTVTDDDTLTTTETLLVDVANVLPVPDAGADQRLFEDDPIVLDPSDFHDQGTLDTHTATIDWGDGTPVEVGAVTETPFGPPGSTAGADGTIAGGHMYPLPGIYTVTVCVADDDEPGAPVCDTFTATVINAFMKFVAFAESSKHGDGAVDDDYKAGKLSVAKNVLTEGWLGANGDIHIDKEVTVGGAVVSVNRSVKIGDGVLVDGSVMARRYAHLKKYSDVAGDVHAVRKLDLHKTAVIHGATYVGADADVFPDVTWITLDITGDALDVKVKDEVHPVTPGTYRSLDAKDAIIELAGGLYVFRDVKTHGDVTINIDLDPDGDGTAEPMVILVERDFKLNGVTEFVITSAVGDATDILVLVGGHTMELGDDGAYLGTFIAGTGKAVLGKNATLDGAAHGRSVKIEHDAVLHYNPALDLFADQLVPVR